MTQKASKGKSINWKQIGFALMITFGTVTLFEIIMYTMGMNGGNIVRMFLGENMPAPM